MRRLICLGLLCLAACSDHPTDPGQPANLVADSATRDGIPVSTPAAEGINEAQLETLLGEAQTQKSDAVIIMRHGKVVYETYFGHPISPIMAMSGSKSFVSLVFGYLLADGKLASVDVRVADIIPGFANSDPRKASITIRQLLSQSSGLDPSRAFGSGGDIELHGIQVVATFPPGTGWQYSNGGIDFLAAVAGHLAGMPMDEYLQQKLFTPMGITGVSWVHDINGVPYGAGEMSINPLDLAKVGQTMLDHGVWRGKQVIPADWIDSSTAMSQVLQPNYGLAWWRMPTTINSVGLTSDLLAQWSAMHGLPDSTIAKLQQLVGNPYPSSTQVMADIRNVLGSADFATMTNWFATGDHIPQYRITSMGRVIGYAAEGWLGQYLAVYPELGIVAVRMRRATRADYVNQLLEVNEFPRFLYEAGLLGG